MTVCHSKTANLPQVVKQADIVIAAVGKAEIVTYYVFYLHFGIFHDLIVRHFVGPGRLVEAWVHRHRRWHQR